MIISWIAQCLYDFSVVTDLALGRGGHWMEFSIFSRQFVAICVISFQFEL